MICRALVISKIQSLMFLIFFSLAVDKLRCFHLSSVRLFLRATTECVICVWLITDTTSDPGLSFVQTEALTHTCTCVHTHTHRQHIHWNQKQVEISPVCTLWWEGGWLGGRENGEWLKTIHEAASLALPQKHLCTHGFSLNLQEISLKPDLNFYFRNLSPWILSFLEIVEAMYQICKNT